MKNKQDLSRLKADIEKLNGFNANHFSIREPNQFTGSIFNSIFKDLTAKLKKDNLYSYTALTKQKTLASELVYETSTIDTELNAKEIHELFNPLALKLFNELTNNKYSVYHDICFSDNANSYIAPLKCKLDGLLIDKKAKKLIPVEVKVLQQRNAFQFFSDEKIPDEYIDELNFTCYVLGVDKIIFLVYYPNGSDLNSTIRWIEYNVDETAMVDVHNKLIDLNKSLDDQAKNLISGIFTKGSKFKINLIDNMDVEYQDGIAKVDEILQNHFKERDCLLQEILSK